MICIPVVATVVGSSSHPLQISGSTTVQPLMVKLQGEFEKFADVDMNITGGGSGVGVSSTLNGIADIGMLSRDLKPGEGPGLVPTVIAMDAVVIIVSNNAGLPDANLSMQDLADIYSGKITNWGDLGGKPGTIATVSREEGSGTRDCFEAALKAADKTFSLKHDGMNYVSSTGAMLAAVNGPQVAAIGYINLNISSEQYNNLSEISVGGIKPSPETVLDPINPYKITRSLILVTKGEPEGMAKFFIDWILSEEGQNIVQQAGFVRIDSR
jgi:phosphate transport system substrate-binding protein